MPVPPLKGLSGALRGVGASGVGVAATGGIAEASFMKLNNNINESLLDLIMSSSNGSDALARMIGDGNPSTGRLTGLNLLLSATGTREGYLFPTTGSGSENSAARRALVASSIARWYAEPAHQNMSPSDAMAAMSAMLAGQAGLDAGQAKTIATAVSGHHERITTSLRSRAAGPTYDPSAPAITVPIKLPPQLGGQERPTPP